MSRGVSPRWIGFGVLAVFGAVVVLTGWGLFLTITQSREIGNTLAYAARVGAEKQVQELEERIAGLEAGLLDRLWGIATEGDALPRSITERLEALEREHALVGVPFLLAADFSLIYPPLDADGESSASPLLQDEPAPEDFRLAFRLLWGEAPQDEARRALESVYRAPEMADPWRLRALAAIASLDLKNGRPEAASRTYEKLFREFPAEIARRTSQPTRLHLVLAHTRALCESGSNAVAAALVSQTLESLLDARISPGELAEERFFHHEVERSTRSTPGSSAQREKTENLLALHRERLDLFRSKGSLESWRSIRDRIHMVHPEADPHTPRHLAGSPESRHVVVWRPGPHLEDGGALAAVGFRLRLDALRRQIDTLLDARAAGPAPESEGFLFRVFEAGETIGGLPMVALSGELSFLRIGVDHDSWQRRVREGRRPYRIAATLIPALGLGMLLALVMFYRGFLRERHLSRLKTDFVANVSHELKTPLALIRLFGETLSLDRVRDEAKRKEYYDIITRESERLTHLINNVLDFASIEANKKSYDLVPTDLGSVVRDTLRTYHFHLEEKGFRVEEEIEPDLPACPADRDAVAQAVINLLNNAVKYSDHRKEVRVRVWQDRESVRISVADRGVGIAAADLERIFEGFYRVKATRTPGRRGSGLGLSLVEHIAQSHGGRVAVQSTPGEGSTFTLAFPFPEGSSDSSDSLHSRTDT